MMTRTLFLPLCLCLGTACNVQPAGDSGRSQTEQAKPVVPDVEADQSKAPSGQLTTTKPSSPPPAPPSGPSVPPQAGQAAEGQPWPTPGKAPERVAIGDLDGDGRPEVLLVGPEGLFLTDARGGELARAPAFGHPNVVTMGPSKGPDRGTFWVGWGYGRQLQKGPARVLRYRYQGGSLTSETVLTHESERPAVSGIALGSWKGKPGAMIAVFADKYFTDLVFVSPRGGAWATEPVAKVRMVNAIALARVRDPKSDDLIIGRLYGDSRSEKGDAFVLDPSGTRAPIPIQGGMRAMATVDLDGDGRAEILVGDGWAQAYARDGRALVTRASFRDGAFRSERVGELPGEFMVQKLVAMDVNGDGRPEILALGNASLTLFRQKGFAEHPPERIRGTGSFAPTRLTAGGPQDFAVGDLDGDGKSDILVAFPQGVRHLKLP